METFTAWAATAGVTHAVQVDAKTVERWMKHLRDVEGLDASTVVDKVMIVTVELRKHGAKIELRPQDLPKVTTKEREVYKPETLQALFAACRPHEYVLYQTFLLTGMREQEVAFLGWDDVDPKRSTVRVRRKPDLGFELKNYQERTIPVPRRLMALLMEHRERTCAGAGLVFATSAVWAARGVKGGQRDKKMLLKLKQLAKRAKLNCGHCVGTANNKPVTCATHAICDKFGLHKFRHTYATTLLRDKLDIVSLQKLLGHKDLDSTRKYLRALEPDDMQAEVEASSLTTRVDLAPCIRSRGRRRAAEAALELRRLDHGGELVELRDELLERVEEELHVAAAEPDGERQAAQVAGLEVAGHEGAEPAPLGLGRGRAARFQELAQVLGVQGRAQELEQVRALDHGGRADGLLGQDLDQQTRGAIADAEELLQVAAMVRIARRLAHQAVNVAEARLPRDGPRHGAPGELSRCGGLAWEASRERGIISASGKNGSRPLQGRGVD